MQALLVHWSIIRFPSTDRAQSFMIVPHMIRSKCSFLSCRSVHPVPQNAPKVNGALIMWHKLLACCLSATLLLMGGLLCSLRRLNKAISYTFDILLPAPIYAPLFGFLLRLALPF